MQSPQGGREKGGGEAPRGAMEVEAKRGEGGKCSNGSREGRASPPRKEMGVVKGARGWGKEEGSKVGRGGFFQRGERERPKRGAIKLFKVCNNVKGKNL